MKRFYPLLIVFFLCFAYAARAQKLRENIKFGEVSVNDFKPTQYSIDSAANAVYLYNSGNSSYVGNNNGFFSVVYEQHSRIRIMHKNGFNAATVIIPLYISNDYQTKLASLEAATYNVENGQVVVTNLDKSVLFTEVHKDITTYKFTFPNVKEGSIVEFHIKVILPDYYSMPDWDFQKMYPVLYSEYEVNVPYFFNYAILKKGPQNYVIDTGIEVRNRYYINEKGQSISESDNSVAVSTQATKHIWAMRNIPAFHRQKFMTAADNYLSGIQFQLSEIRMPEQEVEKVNQSWVKISENLLKSPDFGLELNYSNTWLKNDIYAATANATNNLEKAQGIFTFVRDYYSCIDYDSKFLSGTLKKVVQSRKGNVADINILLTAMLKQEGLEAYPVILSTRDHGKVFQNYPTIYKFNYVITRLVLDNENYYLDASRKNIGFNQLPDECYNGFARVINDKDPMLLRFDADSIKEYQMNVVQIHPDLAFNSFNISVNKTFGNFESQDARNDINNNSLNGYAKEIQKQFSTPIQLKDINALNLKNLDEPLKLQYTLISSINKDDDLIYLNPILSDRILDNPFKAQERIYPIEMPYCTNSTYLFDMDVPNGYVVDEIPKSARVQLNENQGSFEYLIVNKNNHIQMRCRLLLNKANFNPDDYSNLRDFFAFIVQKESEQIVLKKQSTQHP